MTTRMTADELAALRGRTDLSHADRRQLLALVDRLLAVYDAAQVVVAMVPRGPLAPVARQALLELSLATSEVAVADAPIEALDDREEGDGLALERLSA